MNIYLVKIIHSKISKLSKSYLTGLTRFMVALTIYSVFIIPVNYAVSSEYRQAPEQMIKAAYLYKFFFFVHWPDVKQSLTKSDDKIVIGILGDDHFGDHFKEIDGLVIESVNKKIVIKRFGSIRDEINLQQCRILYISSSEKNNFSRILNSTNKNTTLTVSDAKNFLEQGGMVNLVNVKGRIRWELNLAAIEKAGLKVSSTLIQCAVRVIPAP